MHVNFLLNFDELHEMGENEWQIFFQADSELHLYDKKYNFKHKFQYVGSAEQMGPVYILYTQ